MKKLCIAIQFILSLNTLLFVFSCSHSTLTFCITFKLFVDRYLLYFVAHAQINTFSYDPKKGKNVGKLVLCCLKPIKILQTHRIIQYQVGRDLKGDLWRSISSQTILWFYSFRTICSKLSWQNHSQWHDNEY